MKLLKAMATVGGLTGLSRLFGFTRDVMIAAILGASPVADAFFVALKIPNFFRRVTAEGAFSVSFVPLYSQALEKEGSKEADSFAQNIFFIMLYSLGVFTLLTMWAMPWVIYGVAPGFVGDVLRYDLAVELTRITFPYLLFMSLTALLGGVLNARGRFAPFAFAPVIFNIILIAALLMGNLAQTAGHALAYGVLLAGVVQLIWLLVCVRRAGIRIGFKGFKRPCMDAKTRKVFKLMGPGVLGAGVMHINLFADLIIASFLGTGAISYLYYADRLNQLPLSMVGIAVGTALLPMLSKAMSRMESDGEDARAEARELFNRAMEFCLLLALPAAVALAVIPLALVSVLFERGEFSAADSQTTALVLTCYALGLPAYIAVKVFSTAHWARQDTVMPVKIAVAATITNIIMSLMLIWYMGVAGIALATGLTAWMQFFAHLKVLKSHPAAVFDERFKRAMPRIVLSTAIMAAVLYGLSWLLQGWLYDGAGLQVAALAVLVGGGMAVYGASVLGLGVIRLKDARKYFIKRA